MKIKHGFFGGFTALSLAVMFTLTACPPEETVSTRTIAGTVIIAGTPKVGQTLRANFVDPDGNEGPLWYQWKRYDDKGETDIFYIMGKDYTLGAADVSASITVTVTREGFEGAITSTAVGPIQAGDIVPEPQPAPENKTLVSITITSLPTKTTYLVGDPLEADGMVVTVTYSDGSTETKTAAECILSGYTSDTPGEKTVTVSYTEGGIPKSRTFDVTVNGSGGTTDPGPGPSGGNGGISITPPETGITDSDLSFSLAPSAGGFSSDFTVTAPSRTGASYEWDIDGAIQSVTSSTFTVQVSGLSNGVHQVGVKVTIGGQPYYASKTFRVQR